MGMIDWRKCSQNQRQPVSLISARYTKGSRSSCTLKIRIRRRPVKKVGSEKPTKARVEEIWSKIE